MISARYLLFASISLFLVCRAVSAQQFLPLKPLDNIYSLAANTLIWSPAQHTSDSHTPLLAEPAAAKTEKTSYRGWEHLVTMLLEDGVDQETVKSIYQNPRMPRFHRVAFALNPRESRRQYKLFTHASRLNRAIKFLREHKSTFDDAELYFEVDRSVLAAIILVETHCGKVTGNSLIINRLSRIANIGEPKNLQFNLIKHRSNKPQTTLSQVKARAFYLEETFYPEIIALIKIVKDNKLDIFQVKGSHAGAFGIPQFLPSTYIKFAVDGNNDGIVSLFTAQDAIMSTANFLSSYGWKNDATREIKEHVIWKYNHSQAYVEAVLAVADKLKQSGA